MTGSKRIGIVAVYHETNTFSPLRTGLESFERRWYVGDQLADAFRGTSTVCGGFFDEAERVGAEAVPLLGVFATPSGPVDADALQRILDALARVLEAADGLDAVLVELHGDLIVDGARDTEEEIVGLIRSRLPGRPIAAVLDLHANFTRSRLREVEVLLGYRTNPHVDTYERGRAAASALFAILDGSPAPYRAHRGLPIVAPPAAQSTEDAPMRELMAMADALQASEALHDVSVFAGYAYADSDHTGMGFIASADPSRADAAERAVEALRDLAESIAHHFAADYPDADAALRSALDATRPRHPVVVADTGDNINGGAPGDTTWLVHAALRSPSGRFLATIADPNALALMKGEGPVSLTLGGAASPRSGEPIRGVVEVLRVSDGVFSNVGPMARGARVDMGGAAWVRIGRVDIVIQGVAVQPNDPGMFTSLGLDPADYDVLVLKGAAALRAGWSHYTDQFVFAGTPGETDSVLERLRYRHAAVRTDHLRPVGRVEREGVA